MAAVVQGERVAREKAKLRKVLRRFDLVLFTPAHCGPGQCGLRRAGGRPGDHLAGDLAGAVPGAYGTLSATTIATLNGFVLHKPLGTTGEIIVALIFTWLTVGTAIVAFRYGKWAPNVGTFVKIGVIAIFTILFIVFLVQHRGRAVRGDGRPRDPRVAAAGAAPRIAQSAESGGLPPTRVTISCARSRSFMLRLFEARLSVAKAASAVQCDSAMTMPMA